MEATADGLLYLIRAEPTLLSPAAVDEGSMDEAITSRVRDELHPCLRCGGRAVVAYLATTSAGWRWLDLCAMDAQWLLTTMSGDWSPGPPDDPDEI